MLTYLVPTDEASDPAFRLEVERLSVLGVRLVAWISVAANLIGYGIWSLWPNPLPESMLRADFLAFIFIGSFFALSYWKPFRPWARTLGILFLFLVTAEQTLAMRHMQDLPVDAEAFVPVMMAITMLLALACFPLKPLQALALGVGVTMVNFWASFGRTRFIHLSFGEAFPVSIMIIVTLTSAALAAALYHQRAAAFRTRRLAEESLQALQESQARLLVSENAASQSRLAAALCHELNNPLGVLASSLDTLVAAHRRRDEGEASPRLSEVIASSARSGASSLERLERTVDRMKHLTNLDRSEEQTIDLNQLWRDTVALLDESLAIEARVDLELGTIPPFRGQPQKLATVFANLLRNAAAAIEEDGRITIHSRTTNGEIRLEVQDDGRGIEPERLARLFEPDFHRQGARVSTTNWGLFVARGIVTEHGGHLEIESAPGQGTTARILLPLE